MKTRICLMRHCHHPKDSIPTKLAIECNCSPVLLECQLHLCNKIL